MNDNNKKVGRKQKYVFWSDWQCWLLKEWYPFKTNDLPHLTKSVEALKSDMNWVKWLLRGLILALIVAAIAVLTRG